MPPAPVPAAAPTETPLLLEAAGVTVTYNNGHTALRDASFRLEGGTICALVGVNGSRWRSLLRGAVRAHAR